MVKKVFIRADGNRNIGLGHLTRCLALAQMLKNEFDVAFYLMGISEKFSNDINKHGFKVNFLQSEEDFFTILRGNEIVVLDHYGLTSDYQKRVKELGSKLVCIDDIFDKKFHADIIVNQAPGISVQEYQTAPYTKFALGPDYALLRPLFLEAARNQKKQNAKPETIFICFGGSDPKQLTQRILDVAVSYSQFTKINVVLGSANQDAELLCKQYDGNARVSFFKSIDEKEILQLMQSSHVAIVPASGLLLEAFCSGCRIISGKYIDNQQLFFANYLALHAFFSAGAFSVAEVTNAIEEVLSETGRVQTAVIDGRSGERLLKLFVDLFNEFDVALRPATATDTQRTFEWASDKVVRAYSFSQNPILIHEHSNWFLRKIQSDDCFYYIANFKDQPLGSIRFDIQNGVATISYLVDPKFHGQGFGTTLLKMGIECLVAESVRITEIVGEVMIANIGSVKAFEKLGFSKITIGENYKFYLKI